MNSGKQILRDTIITTVWNIISRGIGFLVPVIIASLIGASYEADAYYLASTLPLFFIQIVVIALSSVFVPVLIQQIVHTPDEVELTISSIFTFLFVLSLLISFVYGIFVPTLLPLFVSGLDTITLNLAIELAMLLLPIICLSIFTGATSAVLNAHKQFVGPILVPGIRAIIVILVALLAYPIIGIHALVWGTLLGELISLIALLYLIVKIEIRLHLNFQAPTSVKQMLILSIPMIVGMVLIRFNPIVDRFMAAPLGHGSIAALDYADKLITIPTTLLGSGLLVVILSHWSGMVANGQTVELQFNAIKVLSTVAFFSVPLSFFLFIVQKPLVQFALERGAFDAIATQRSAMLFGFLALGFAPNAVSLVYVRMYLVLKETKLLMILGLINMTLNLLLNYIFINIWGLQGIAISTSITYLIVTCLLGVLLKQKMPFLFVPTLWMNWLKICVASIISAAVLLLVMPFFDLMHSSFFVLTSASLLMVGLYLALAYIQRIDDARILVAQFKQSIYFVYSLLGGNR